ADKVVSIDYTLKDDQGTVIDTSNERGPLSFIFGSGTIIPGLENELEGREKGDSFSVTVEPKDGYGEYDDSMMFEVGKDQFQDSSQIEEGMQVQAQNNQGQVQILTVKSIGDENVTLDANHPLAGQKLFFDVSVTDVRDATEEEIDHGHVH
ncbi:MAG: peptidylprolyl isomerase, partial [Spirochaetota bacterium]|nr:peptidylprolyl isomerase [Spirochaetota bacterium]